MKSTYVAVVAVVMIAVGMIAVMGFTSRALSWHGAENYDALWVAILGPPIAIVQVVMLVLTFWFTRRTPGNNALLLRAVGFLFALITAGSYFYLRAKI